MAIEYHGHLPSLQEAFRSGKLTFYLGAGASKSNDPPSWEEFVQALYFTTLNDESFIYDFKPYPNYLFALLDSIRSRPLPRKNFILMRKPQFTKIKDPSPELDQIRQKTEEYLTHFPQSRWS